MTQATLEHTIPRVALTRREAAAALGCGLTWFEQEVQPELKLIRRGSKVLVPVVELERWCHENATLTLGS